MRRWIISATQTSSVTVGTGISFFKITEWVQWSQMTKNINCKIYEEVIRTPHDTNASCSVNKFLNQWPLPAIKRDTYIQACTNKYPWTCHKNCNSKLLITALQTYFTSRRLKECILCYKPLWIENVITTIKFEKSFGRFHAQIIIRALALRLYS